MAQRILFLLLPTYLRLVSAAFDPLITPPPSYLAHARLAKRTAAFTDTCGYVSGDSKSALTCPQGYTCTFGGDYNWFGCCNELDCASSSGAKTCYSRDGGSCIGQSAFNQCTQFFGSALACSEPSAPNCVSYVRITDQAFGTSFTSYSCGPTPTNILVLKSVTSAGEAIPSASGSTAFVLPSSTTNPFQASQSDGSSSTPTTSPSPTTLSNSSGGLSKTAIIAIAAIGGLIVIVGVILLWIYCLSGCLSRCFSKRANGSSAWASQAGDSRRKKGRAGRTEDWILQARSMGAGASQNGDPSVQQSTGHPSQGQYMPPAGPYGQNQFYGYNNSVPSQGYPAYSDMSSGYNYR